MIAGKTIEEWKSEIPLIEKIINTEETFWENDKTLPFEDAARKIPINTLQIQEAENLLNRFSTYISTVFPETRQNNGLIESPVKVIQSMKNQLNEKNDNKINGELILKLDSHLPISGSIKARGGIFEVLKHAETLAIEAGILDKNQDYSILASKDFKDFFSRHKISVGSTGNLGLSIGIMGAKLGFDVTVHMSSDAKQWKKNMLREKGVTVVEYDSDYSKAVEEGRKMANKEPNNYFIDDENSLNLFLGYAVAASRLKKQLENIQIDVNSENPLFVFLPCGVGGGPGGVAFGLKQIYRDDVHIFFCEPTHSPCMFLGTLTGKHDEICVQDFGLDNKTVADGLAVGRPSSFIGKTLENMINGFFGVSDENILKQLSILSDTENINLEPSALAGIASLVNFVKNDDFEKYVDSLSLKGKNINHLIWATGGSMVPENIKREYYLTGKNFL